MRNDGQRRALQPILAVRTFLLPPTDQHGIASVEIDVHELAMLLEGL